MIVVTTNGMSSIEINHLELLVNVFLDSLKSAHYIKLDAPSKEIRRHLVSIHGVIKNEDWEGDYSIANGKLRQHEEPQVLKELKPRGRKPLTQNEIASRRKIVKKANELKNKNPNKTWKWVAKESNVSERTLRYWRHDPRITEGSK